jgi:hypothetical protein
MNLHAWFDRLPRTEPQNQSNYLHQRTSSLIQSSIKHLRNNNINMTSSAVSASTRSTGIISASSAVTSKLDEEALIEDGSPLMESSAVDIIDKDICNILKPYPRGSWKHLLFSNEIEGKRFRYRITLMWGCCAMICTILFLNMIFQYNLAVSFFVASTTITSIGYGPVVTDPNITDHQYMAIYFLVGVLPFTILQGKQASFLMFKASAY